MPLSCDAPIIDAHVHLIDFCPETEGLAALAHCGISRNVRVQDHLEIVRRLAQQYENLAFDLSWRKA